MEAIREGTILAGKYRVDRVLGAGGMGMVVAATHVQLDQRVALKFMLPEALAHAEASQRFLREARAAVKLKSEHVAKVLDVGTLDTGAPYIVMEYLEGRDLGAVLQSRGRLPVEEAAEYILHACDALAEAHSVGIVHRDIKPANLFVARRPDGAPLVKVLDFGISKASTLGDSNPNALTRTASMLGTPLYMSPEQMKSARDVDARSDVWSLGVVMYEMFGGRVPFDAETVGALMAKVLVETPAPLRVLRPDLPETIAALVGSCLEKEPRDRCAHVAEIAERLAPFAPPRARPIAERVSGILNVPRASLVEAANAATAPMAPTANDAAANANAPTGIATESSWAGGRASIPRARGRARVAIAVAALAAAGAVVAVAGVWMRSRGHSEAPAASASALAPTATSAPIAAAAVALPSLPPLSDPAPLPSATSAASTVPSVSTPTVAHAQPARAAASSSHAHAPVASVTPPAKPAPEAPPPPAPTGAAPTGKEGTAGHKIDL